MGLDTTVRSGVATINKITTPLQVNVAIKPWISADNYGTPSFGSAYTIKGLVDKKQQERKTASGQLVMTKATVTFVQPLPVTNAPNRVNPVDPRDIVTLPDGTTGPIVDTDGFLDPGTGYPYLTQVFI